MHVSGCKTWHTHGAAGRKVAGKSSGPKRNPKLPHSQRRAARAAREEQKYDLPYKTYGEQRRQELQALKTFELWKKASTPLEKARLYRKMRREFKVAESDKR